MYKKVIIIFKEEIMPKVKRLESVRVCDRVFKVKELRLIKDVISLYPGLSRTELAKTVGELLQWYQANGEPKRHSV